MASVIMPLSTDTQASKCAENENHAKKRSQHSFVPKNSNHFITLQVLKRTPALFVFRSFTNALNGALSKFVPEIFRHG